MTRLFVATAAIAIGLVAATALPSSAVAAGGGFTITRITSPGLAVHSGSCHDVAIVAETNADPDLVTSVDAEVDVWHGGKYLGQAQLSETSDSTELAGSYYYCPNLDPVGTYRLGNTQVSWIDSDYDTHDFTSKTRGTAVVKQSTKLVAKKSSSSGGRITGYGKFFGAGGGANEWLRWNDTSPLKVQKRKAGSDREWVTIASGHTIKAGGSYSISVKLKRSLEYRVTSRATAHSEAAISPTIRG